MEIFTNRNAKTILTNLTYLSILKCLGMLFPLITYPLVIRTVGAEKYGLVIYASAFVSYFIVFMNFGFDVSATRRCSEDREDINKVSQIYSCVVYLKSAVFLIGTIIALILLFTIGAEYNILLLCFVGLCIQEIFFPIWLFQALEKMKFITIISFSSQCLYVILLICFIRQPSDYILIPIFQSLGGLLTSVCSIIILRKKFGIKLTSVSKQSIHNTFWESLPFFASRFSAIVMEKTNIIVIGNFFSMNMVAIYDLCAKIVSMLQIPFSLVAQVLYPNVAKSKNMHLVKRLIVPILIAGIFLSLSTIILSKPIVLLLGGEKMIGAIPILCIMVWYAPVVGISYLFGASTLVVCGYAKHYNLSVIFSVVIYLVITGILVSLSAVNLYTMALSFIIPEVCTATYRAYITKKYKLLQ